MRTIISRPSILFSLFALCNVVLVFAVPADLVTLKKREGKLYEACYTGTANSNCVWFAPELYGQNVTILPPPKDDGIQLKDCEKEPGTDGKMCKVQLPQYSEDSPKINFVCNPIPGQGLPDQPGTITWDNYGPHIQSSSRNYRFTSKKTSDQRYFIAELVCDVQHKN